METKTPFSKSFILIGICCLILFGIIGWGVAAESGWVNSLDMAVIHMIQSDVSQGKTALLTILTELGNIRLVIVLTIILSIILFIKKRYAEGLWFGGTILFCAAIGTKLLKVAFDRSRPEFLQLVEKTTESFPSGHATSTTIFYGFLGLVLILLTAKLWKKVVVVLVTLIFIGFILVTRIYLGAHFPTDVIAGFLYGVASVFISIGVYQLTLQPLRHILQKIGLKDQSEGFTKHVKVRQQ